jgi:hypothetical protein
MFAPSLVIVLSSFLLFLVQPIIAKQILPWFGGSAGVWTICLVFFQVALLLGYLYAHWLTRRRRQLPIHVGLLILSSLALPIIPAAHWKPALDADPTLQILGLLLATVGLPYFLLASTAPLLQHWLAHGTLPRLPERSIYRLYAWSNLGSIVGLISYPFALEPASAVRTQAWLWSGGYLVFGIALMAYVFVRRTSIGGPAESVLAAESGGSAPTPGLYCRWLACATLGSVLLLAISNHISENIASIPLLWVLPLGVYLFSFVVCFEGRDGRGWYSRTHWSAPSMLAVGAMAGALTAGHMVLSIYVAIPIYVAGLFAGCVLCHGELARSRPHPAFLTRFYLTIAAGGALGGFLVAVLAPHVLSSYWEAPLAFIALALLGLCCCADELRAQGPGRWLLAVLIACIATALTIILMGALPAPIYESLYDYLYEWTKILDGEARWGCAALAVACALALQYRNLRSAVALAALLYSLDCGWNYYHYLTADTELLTRNFYGAFRIKNRPMGDLHLRSLVNGVILHGSQVVEAPESRIPTSYYGPTSGIGRLLGSTVGGTGSRRIGLIGLGAGTLAAYGKPGDLLRIYELNPEAKVLASTRFSYLGDSNAKVELELGDGRLSLESELTKGRYNDPAQRYDVLAVDAFAGDAIPMHLLTRQAFELYRHVVKPHGIIALHLSNKYLDLAPVIINVATAAHCQTLFIADRPESDRLSVASDWLLVTQDPDVLQEPELARYGTPVPARPELGVWTDEFNNLIRVLR